MYNLFRDIAYASKNRLGEKNVNTENTLFSDLKHAAKLCQSEKLLAKPDGLNKIPMLIANRNAYQSVIADLLKP